MPLYVLKCDACILEIEKIQGINEESPDCPECGGAMRKKFSPIAMFKMKGLGGYPSLRKAYQAGGRNLVDDAKKTRRWV
jgi:putative FmdB family regulatory protein